jgi:hypothetical protein
MELKVRRGCQLTVASPLKASLAIEINFQREPCHHIIACKWPELIRSRLRRLTGKVIEARLA